MEARTNQSLTNSKQGKDKKISQRKVIFLELFKEPMNTKMLHVKTGIPREDICRRKRDLEDENLLWVMKMDYCPIPGHLVQFLTTIFTMAQKIK